MDSGQTGSRPSLCSQQRHETYSCPSASGACGTGPGWRCVLTMWVLVPGGGVFCKGLYTSQQGLNHVGTGLGWRCFLQGPLHCGSRVEVRLNHVGTGRVEVFSSRAFTLPSRVLTMWVLVPGGGVFFKGLYTSQQGLNHVGTGRGWRCFLQGPLHCGSRVAVCLNYVGTGRVEGFSARTFTLPSKVLTMWVLVPGGGVFCCRPLHFPAGS